jgi:hypothetical protein
LQKSSVNPLFSPILVIPHHRQITPERLIKSFTASVPLEITALDNSAVLPVNMAETKERITATGKI